MADEITQADMNKAIKDAIATAKDEWETEKQAETEGLKNKNKELLGKLRAATEIKPEEVSAIEAERDQLAAEKADLAKQVKDLSRRAETAEKSLETETGFTRKLLVENGIKSALIANGVKDEDFIDTLTAKFTGGATVKIEGDDRKAVIGDKEVSEAIKEWAGSDAGKKFVSAPLNGGGGRPGGGQPSDGKANPFAKDTHNLSEQGRLYRENPEQAKQLAQEAGVKLAG